MTGLDPTRSTANRLLSRRVLLQSGAIVGTAVFSGTAVAIAAALHRPAPHGSPDKFRITQQALFAKYGTPVTERFLPLGRALPPLRVHVLEAGAGEPVLMLHGGNGVAAGLEPLLHEVQQRFHVVAPDRPGCGLSDMIDYRVATPTVASFRAHCVAFVTALLDELDLTRVSIVANSMGGYWALVFALAHAERVRRLVLVGEPAASAARPAFMRRLLGIPGINSLLYATVLRPSAESIRQSYRRMLVAHVERVSREMLECSYAAAVLPGAQLAWLSMLERVTTLWGPSELTYALRPELAHLAVPTLFVWGDRDTFGPPSLGEEMSRIMPNARAEVVVDAGHLVWLDQPERCARLVTEFLAVPVDAEPSKAR